MNEQEQVSSGEGAEGLTEAECPRCPHGINVHGRDGCNAYVRPRIGGSGICCAMTPERILADRLAAVQADRAKVLRIAGDWFKDRQRVIGERDFAIERAESAEAALDAARRDAEGLRARLRAVEAEVAERIARCIRTEAHPRNDASWNRALLFAAGCALAKYDSHDAHSFCVNPETCPRCSLSIRDTDESGPDQGFASLCTNCGRGLVSEGEWCCGDFTPRAALANPPAVRCDTCSDAGRVPWMIEGDPNCYQERDGDDTIPCPDCCTATPPPAANGES